MASFAYAAPAPYMFDNQQQSHCAPGVWYPPIAYGVGQPYGAGMHHNYNHECVPFPAQVPQYYYPQPQPPQPLYLSRALVDTRGVQANTYFHHGRRPSQSARPVAKPAFQTPVSDVPRGPPRKPKQSGHALWIGNLPPNASIFELKDYCSQDATEDIESVFLISSSNCAFANYKTHQAAEAAIQRIQTVTFQERRLVCRLRIQDQACSDSSPTTSIASDDASTSTLDISEPTPERKDSVDPLIVGSDICCDRVDTSTSEKKQHFDASSLNALSITTPKASERYFILKSLTVQDLIASVNNGTWQAQSHRENTLQDAFAQSDNVYLIFSANKSGEYFGVARMTSNMYNKVDKEHTSAITESTDNTTTLSLQPPEPQYTHTPATDHAPAGKVYDDSARGTLFWEADHAASTSIDASVAVQPINDDESVVELKQFNVQWLSTSRVSFHRTRGLRNPWNGWKEVKIARDGTELETGVGRMLVGMFNLR